MTIKIKDIQTFAVLTEPETQVVIGGDSNSSQNNFRYYSIPILDNGNNQPLLGGNTLPPSSYSYSAYY